MSDKITYEDIEEYGSLFSMAPSFLLEGFARKNTNIVLKFKPTIQARLDNMTEAQSQKLDLILNMAIEDIQILMNQAYQRTNIKQYKILSNPKYKQFIEDNLNEIRKMRG